MTMGLLPLPWFGFAAFSGVSGWQAGWRRTILAKLVSGVLHQARASWQSNDAGCFLNNGLVTAG